MDAVVIGPNPQQNRASRVEMVQPIMGMSEEEFAKLAMSVMIMVPNRGSVHPSFVTNGGFWARFGSTIAPVEDLFGGFVEQVRANMCDLFRRVRADRPELKYLVMIDSDEQVQWDAPYRLAAWQMPVVSGIVCSYAPQRGIFANIFVKDEFGKARMPSWNKTKAIPGKGLQPCHSVGTGLICIRHDVIDSIVEGGEMPFVLDDENRRMAYDTGVLKLGEDTTFCQQARRKGFEIYADFGVRAVHFKTIPVEWPQSAIDYSMDVRKWKVDPGDYHHG